MRENEHKEENCSTKWRDRHRKSITTIQEKLLTPPMGINIAACSVISGCCITLLAGIQNPEQNKIAQIAIWSGTTFISTLAFSYLYLMCKSPQVSDNQESKR